ALLPRDESPASLASTNAIPHCQALNPRLIAGRYRQPQHHVSVAVYDEERQPALISRRAGLLLPLARYFPPVLVLTGSAEGERHPAEGPVGIDPGRAADLKGMRRLRGLGPRPWRRYLIGCDRGLAADQQHGVRGAGA